MTFAPDKPKDKKTADIPSQEMPPMQEALEMAPAEEAAIKKEEAETLAKTREQFQAELPSKIESQQGRPRKDQEAVKEAQNFFRSLGLVMEDNGLIDKKPTEEQIAKLHEWHEQTRGEGGIDMPTEEAFYEKVLLAISLWRQQEGEKTNYLLGKGTGVEVALRGNIAGRTKRPIEFSYRSHSDLELYGVDYEAGENGENLSGKSVYTEPFKRVFGSQEIFPLTKTKGLKNIPPTLLHETAEVVDFGGVPIRIPQLELLFLDKYEASESTPRPEGSDAELLARQYVLDRTRIYQYWEQFVMEPAVAEIQSKTRRDYQSQLDGIKRNLSWIKKEFEEEGIDFTPQDLVARINERMQSAIDLRSAKKSVSYSGVRLNLWQSLSAEQIDADGNVIDQEFLQSLQEKTMEMETATIERYKGKRQELDKLFDNIDREFAAEEKKE